MILKREVHAKWARLASQGAGADWYRRDPYGHFWLLNQSALRPGQFIDALQMRTDTYGTRVAINRAAREATTRCRRCPAPRETLGYILGQCSAGDFARQERHNFIVGMLEEDCISQGLTTAREQDFQLPGGSPGQPVWLRPDLVVNSRDRSYIIDVTVRLEDKDSLSAAHLEK